ncbi:MAG: response regulator transcription factor [Actinomycetota bacterium]|jgi:DNA-binding response OmpR family regulator|nr:response regulator transcription factor [Actinomycetota bacterium]
MRILLIEDEKKLATALKRGLEAEGFSVDVAHDGTEGLWMARESEFSVIVSDIMLPGTNGFKICSTLRQEGNWTPILMLTAKDGDLDEAEALDTGADDYLIKPFSFVVLVARIRALLRRGALERPPVVEVGDISLDRSAHRIWRGSTEVELTPREFSLMDLFMSNPGTALHKRDILDQVWDDDFERDPNIVEVYVGYLRRKVDEPFGRRSIQTVRGIGYRMEAHGG